MRQDLFEAVINTTWIGSHVFDPRIDWNCPSKFEGVKPTCTHH